jgi:sialic acid synthase SpsE
MIIDKIDTNKQVMIVAEIGNNHEGNFELAKELIKIAAGTGVDAVKFQTMKAETFVASTETERFKKIKSFEFTINQFYELSIIAKQEGIVFFSTPFDIQSVSLLNAFTPCFKIASGDNNYFRLIKEVLLTKKPVIISTGLVDMSFIFNIQKFINKVFQENNFTQEIAYLHCVSSYPVPDHQVNLNSIPFLIENLKCTIGYSDHSLGIEASIASVALGARIIEKHFTIDKKYSNFRDHSLSADPIEMKNLVSSIRRLEPMIGDKNKLIQSCEEEGLKSSRRSIYSSKEIQEKEILSLDKIISLRPNHGLSTELELEIADKKSNQKIPAGKPLQESYLN